jgi:hypothetical protein
MILASALLVGSADAQVVRGVLQDAESDAPIVGGTVTLMDAADSVLARAIADDRGEFVLRAPAEGEFRLAGSRIGYADAAALLFLGERVVVDVIFRLSVSAVLLEPITVEARRRITPGSILNAERRERGLGVFLTQEDVLARTRHDVRDALVDLEGIRVRAGRNGVDCGLGRARGSGIPLWDGNCLTSSMGWGCMIVVINELPAPDGFVLSDVLPPAHQVSAIEVYRTYREVPNEHKLWAWPTGRREPCGVVAIWTHAAW